MDALTEPEQEASYVAIQAMAGSYGRSLFAKACLGFAFTGFQAMICLYGAAVFLETPREGRKGRLPYIVLSLMIFLSSTVSAALDGFATLDSVRSYGQSEELLEAPENVFFEIRQGPAALQLIWIALGDGVLLFRCYIIWHDKWWLVILPLLAYLAAIGTQIMSIAVYDGTNPYQTLTLTVLFPVLFNIIATGLIIFRLMRWRRKLLKALPSRSLTNYSAAATVLAESAFPLALFGICYVASGLVGYRQALALNAFGQRLVEESGGSITHETLSEGIAMMNAHTALAAWNYAFEALYKVFAILSPQFLIFRISTGRSFTRSNEVTAATFSSPLVFAPSQSLNSQRSVSQRSTRYTYKQVQGDVN
ncbi:hypothetical protein FA15DRAFT_628371 [Coprinopsis marcescibilis]|uniref:Uncharacterized protein n=1 Tax=Coprinopsis marcescibilis TaxID=230819 RepID=A0A5C3KD59_COPMA|nr:hypothetical protein FA15DRAFT_628371 [Coprinopsis marcescibilis]